MIYCGEGGWEGRRRARAAFVLTVIGLAAPRAPAAAEPAPTIELGESAVTVHVPPPGRRAMIFGFGHEVRNHITTLVRWEQVLSAPDAAGALRLELERPLPPASMWAAVDASTGQVGKAMPPGVVARELPHPPRHILPGATTIDLELPMAEVLLVRHGGRFGVWGLRAGDGGASDVDGEQNGIIRIALSDMWPIADSGEPPAEVSGGDVLLILNPMDLGFCSLRIAAAGGQQCDIP